METVDRARWQPPSPWWCLERHGGNDQQHNHCLNDDGSTPSSGPDKQHIPYRRHPQPNDEQGRSRWIRDGRQGRVQPNTKVQPNPTRQGADPIQHDEVEEVCSPTQHDDKEEEACSLTQHEEAKEETCSFNPTRWGGGGVQPNPMRGGGHNKEKEDWACGPTQYDEVGKHDPVKQSSYFSFSLVVITCT